jgi:DNA anti-recombination protein RmuC
MPGFGSLSEELMIGSRRITLMMASVQHMRAFDAGHREIVAKILSTVRGELTNELVDWFNSVDATYQSDLRELNEHNFMRFDAKLEQRLAGVDAKIDSLAARLDAKIDSLAARLDAKIDSVAAELDARMVALESRLLGQMNQRFAEQRESLTAQLSAFESRMTRWMVALWTSTMLAIVGLLVAVLRAH